MRNSPRRDAYGKIELEVRPMSDTSLYVAPEVMDHWPFLPLLQRDASFTILPHEDMDRLFLALNAKQPSTPLLAWRSGPEAIYGCWRPTAGLK